jgi:uncharacterized protein
VGLDAAAPAGLLRPRASPVQTRPAAADARLRIEAGRGVQGVLTDAQSKRILEDTISPYFRKLDWYGGLHAGVGAIEVLLDKENLPAPQRHVGSQMVPYIVLTIIALATLGMMIAAFIVFRADKRSRRKARPVGTERRDKEWVDSTPAFAFSSNDNSSSDSSSSDSSSDFSGDGGTFDGGGASGDWDD